MAPVPSRLHADAVTLISTCEGRHNHISKTLIPELGACVGPYSVQQRLSDDIREAIAALCRQIDVCTLYLHEYVIFSNAMLAGA